jgi:anti-anti-sigma factor
VREGLA